MNRLAKYHVEGDDPQWVPGVDKDPEAGRNLMLASINGNEYAGKWRYKAHHGLICHISRR